MNPTQNETYSKYKHILAKGYTSNCSEETFGTRKVRNTLSWLYEIEDLNDKEIFGMFYEK